jgi:hypothetical protein
VGRGGAARLLAGGIGPRAAIAVAGALILMTPFLRHGQRVRRGAYRIRPESGRPRADAEAAAPVGQRTARLAVDTARAAVVAWEGHVGTPTAPLAA